MYSMKDRLESVLLIKLGGCTQSSSHMAEAMTETSVIRMLLGTKLPAPLMTATFSLGAYVVFVLSIVPFQQYLEKQVLH